MSPTLPLTHRPTAYTLIELLAVMFVVAMTGLVEESVAHRFGRWTGIGAGAVTLVSCVMGVVLFYRWSWKRDRRRLQELREKYRGIYRVIALPSDQKIVAKPLPRRIIRSAPVSEPGGPGAKPGEAANFVQHFKQREQTPEQIYDRYLEQIDSSGAQPQLAGDPRAHAARGVLHDGHQRGNWP